MNKSQSERTNHRGGKRFPINTQERKKGGGEGLKENGDAFSGE